MGITTMVGHILVVRGRGAACALGAAYAMDPAMMTVDLVPLVGGSLLHRHPQAVAVTAVSPAAQAGVAPSPVARAMWSLLLIGVLFAARTAGQRRVTPGHDARDGGGGSGWTETPDGGRGVRVGLVTPYSWTVPGGVNHHVEHLAAELEDRGHEAWILAPVGASSPRRSVDSLRHPFAERFIPMGGGDPCPHQRLARLLWPLAADVTRIDRAVRYGRFDVLHVHEPWTPMVALAAVLLAASPVVGTFHAALERSRGYDDWAWLLRKWSTAWTCVIAVSEAAREFPASRYPGDYRIIPNGIPVERFAVCHEGVKVKGRILFIGRAEPRKGLDVRAAAARSRSRASVCRTRRSSSPARRAVR